MRRRPFRLVPAEISHETVEALDQLLVMCRGRDYFVDAAGEAHRSPTFARGMVNELNDALGRRARGE